VAMATATMTKKGKRKEEDEQCVLFTDRFFGNIHMTNP